MQNLFLELACGILQKTAGIQKAKLCRSNGDQEGIEEAASASDDQRDIARPQGPNKAGCGKRIMAVATELSDCAEDISRVCYVVWHTQPVVQPC